MASLAAEIVFHQLYYAVELVDFVGPVGGSIVPKIE
jgi:hypothetical protein